MMSEYESDFFTDFEMVNEMMYDNDTACECCGNARATDNGLCPYCNSIIVEIKETLKNYPDHIVKHFLRYEEV